MELVSLDPGKSSGVAVLYYDSIGVRLLQAFQVSPGVGAFRNLLDSLQESYPSDSTTWVCEKFSPRPNEGFSQGLDSTLPLVCEGVVIDRNLLPEYTKGGKNPRWVQPPSQYLVGGKDLADKKKRQHKFLDESGFRIDSKVLGYKRPDYNDARSAAAHGLKYLASVENHKPTFDLISNWVERNPA